MKNILSKLKQSLLVVPLLALAFSAVASPSVVLAATAATCDETNLTMGSGAACAAGTGQENTKLFGAEDSIFKTVTNILLFLVGAISVIMLILGGIRYVISSGDQAQVTAAKNTILYAIVGIVIAFLAYAAVSFVTGQFVE